MAHHRLGRHDDAGRMMDDVARYVEEVPKFGLEVTCSDYALEKWLILHVALRETGGRNLYLERGDRPDVTVDEAGF